MVPVSPSRTAELYRRHFSDPRRERLFLSSIAFVTTFAATRAITHAIRSGRGPFRNLAVGGRHLHHLVFGITGLLATGYLWLIDVGIRESGRNRTAYRLTAVAYGASSALTLDEFALWLDLQDDYWSKQGRKSIDAVVIFGGVLSVGIWGGPFFRELVREARRVY